VLIAAIRFLPPPLTLIRRFDECHAIIFIAAILRHYAMPLYC